MTDKEILNEVYKMCCNPFERCDVKSFIEQEWQKQDELDDWRTEVFAKNDDGQTYYNRQWQGGSRHVSLEIDEDGTVTGIK